MGVLDVLLGEEFNPSAHPRDWHGKFRVGDMVRLKKKDSDGLDIVGRIQRFTDDGKKAIVSPVRGGAHVEAGPADVAFHTPKSHAQAIARQAKLDAERIHSSGYTVPSGVNDPNFARARKAREQQAAAAAGNAGAAKVKESAPAGIGMLVEAFNAPAETPQQSAAIGARQVAQARKDLGPGGRFDPNKHPRGGGGKFRTTTGGKRATRSQSASSRTVGVGASGSFVRSVQRQLGIKTDGVYGTQTKAAVERYQRQHGLQVDGVIGRQTLAALRGHSSPKSVKPGPIASKSATVLRHRSQRRPRAGKSGSPQRFGGGVVV